MFFNPWSSIFSPSFQQLRIGVILAAFSLTIHQANGQGGGGGNPLGALGGLGLPIPNLGQLFGGGQGGQGGFGLPGIPGNHQQGYQQPSHRGVGAQPQGVPPLLSRLRGGTWTPVFYRVHDLHSTAAFLGFKYCLKNILTNLFLFNKGLGNLGQLLGGGLGGGGGGPQGYGNQFGPIGFGGQIPFGQGQQGYGNQGGLGNILGGNQGGLGGLEGLGGGNQGGFGDFGGQQGGYNQGLGGGIPGLGGQGGLGNGLGGLGGGQGLGGGIPGLGGGGGGNDLGGLGGLGGGDGDDFGFKKKKK